MRVGGYITYSITIYENSPWREEEVKKADNGLKGYVIVIISNFKAFVFTKRIVKGFFFMNSIVLETKTVI